MKIKTYKGEIPISSKDGLYVPSVAPQNGSPNRRKSERPIPETDASTNTHPTNIQIDTNADDEHIFNSKSTFD